MSDESDQESTPAIRDCSFCKGEGVIGSVPCPACHGHCRIAVTNPPTPCPCCDGFGVAGCCRCSVCNGTGWSGVIWVDHH